MKTNKLISVLSVGALMVSLVACESKEQSFPDFDGGTTAYFAYQYPVRTLILGEVDTYDNTSDNEGRFTIYGTFGGSYNGCNAKINVSIDESLVEGLSFEDGSPVKAMPTDYYEVVGEKQLDYAGGYRGGLEIKLNDKFFNDTLSVKRTYVIPVVMGDFTGVDKINRGTPVVDGSSPLRQNPTQWDPQPKDYTLFCVNYINKYNATFLRRGFDSFDDMKFKTDTVGENSFIVVHAGKKAAEVWDTQFWINLDHEFKKGENWKASFDVKAKVEAKASTQTHKEPGTYLSGNGFGDVNFGVDWTTFTASGTFSADGGNSIAFNLNELADANDYYIDNVSFVIDSVEYITNIECNDVDCNNFYTKESQGATVKSSYDKEPVVEVIPVGYQKEKAYRHKEYVEYDEVVSTTTKSMNSIVMPIASMEVNDVPLTVELLLTFDENGNCTVKSNTPGVKVDGTGKYLEKSEKLAWGNKDRDGLYLNYTVEMFDAANNYTVRYATTDTLVWRDRGAAASIQTFKPSYKE